MNNLDIELLMYYSINIDQHPNIVTSGVSKSTLILQECGLIKPSQLGSGMQTTKRGKKYIEMLCNTPLPEVTEVWVDPRA